MNDAFPELKDRLRMMTATRTDDIRDEADLGSRLGSAAIAHMEQVHGDSIEEVTADSRALLKCDALLTRTPDLVLIVKWADCQNFVIYDPVHHALGAVHAGWRGMALTILTKTFDVMNSKYGTHAEDCYVFAGPSLCAKHAEFTDPYAELPAHLHPFIEGRTINLPAAADAELSACGVRPDRFMRDPDHTCCLPDQYWTVRGRNCGPNATVMPDPKLRQRNLIGACLL